MGIRGGDLCLYVLLKGSRPYFLVLSDVVNQNFAGRIDLIAKNSAFPLRTIVVV